MAHRRRATLATARGESQGERWTTLPSEVAVANDLTPCAGTREARRCEFMGRATEVGGARSRSDRSTVRVRQPEASATVSVQYGSDVAVC